MRCTGGQVGREWAVGGKGRTPGEPQHGDPLQLEQEKPESHESGLAGPPSGMTGWEKPKQGRDWLSADLQSTLSKGETCTQNSVANSLLLP